MPKIEDSDHRLFAEKVYHHNAEAWKETIRVQAEMGRWLLATMTAVHLGATYIVASSSYIPAQLKVQSIPLFVLGIVYILIAGLCAWINWGYMARFHGIMARPAMIFDTDDWPSPPPDWPLAITYWASLLFGVGSAICLPVGAWIVLAPSP
jgi:hypothetical protein